MKLAMPFLKLSFFIFLILIVVIFIHSDGFGFSFKINIDDYLYTSWLFNYDYGFMRRALIGELISLLGFSYDYKVIRFISLIIYIVLFFVFSVFLVKSLKKVKVDGLYLYVGCILSFSFFTSQWLLELGRFDQIVQILSLIVLYVSLKINNYIFSFLCVFVVIVLSALIHEASLIIFIPTLILIFYLKSKNIYLTILLSSFLLLAVLLMLIFGKISIPQANHIVELHQADKKFNLYAVRTTTLSFRDNFLSSYYSFFDNKTYIPLILSFIFIYPVFSFLKHCYYKNIKLYVLIPTLTPLALALIAFDYYRWVALALFNITILTFYLINSEKISGVRIKEYFEQNKRFFIVYAAICLFVGPFGVVRFLPNIYSANSGGLATTRLPSEVLLKLNLEASTQGQLFSVSTNNAGWRLETNFIQDHNIEKAIQWYEVEAAEGNPQAKNNLALIYTRGGFIQIDYQKALSLLKSISSIDPDATNNLGVMYANGLGVEANGEKALIYYHQAVEQGSAAAMYNIGISYSHGLNGLKQDKKEAQIWFKKAAILGYRPAVNKVKN